jgi:homogentisate phytyltransferase/homogentisate geranylgeranyltransferase
MKDVPDAIGDAKFNIRSFTVRIGQKTVFTSMRRLLTALFFGVGAGFTRFAVQAFASAAAASTSVAASTSTSTCTLGIGRSIVAISAFAAGISVRQEAQSVNAEDSGEVYNYYMHLWKLFYASYLVLPFAR